MKKTLALILALALAVSLCGAAFAEEQHTPVTLKLMSQSTGDGNPEYDAMIAEFQTLYPWITIQTEYLGIGDGYSNALLSRLRGTDAPDLFHCAAGRGEMISILPLAEEGYAMDLSDQAWGATIVPEAYRSAWQLDGKTYAIPFQVTPIIVEYNSDRFEELGLKVPETFDEFMEIGRASVEKGQPFIVVSGTASGHCAHLVVAVAMSTVYANEPDWDAKRYAGEVTFAGSEAWHETFEKIQQMVDAGLFLEGSAGMDTNAGHIALANGDALIRFVPAGNIRVVENVNPEINLQSFAMPGNTADETCISANATSGIAAFAKTAHPEEVKLFMDYVATKGANIYAEVTGNISMGEMLEGVISNPQLAGVADVITREGHLFDNPNTTWPNAKVVSVMGTGVQGLLTGTMTIDQILSEMDAAWEEK